MLTKELGMKIQRIIIIGLIAIIVALIIQRQIKEYHLQNDPMLKRLRAVMIPVHPVFKTVKLYEGEKSYTINKERIYLSLRDKNGDYYELNTLVYAVIHEVAHLLNTHDVGHTPMFHKIFDQLLEQAKGVGCYNPSVPIRVDYST